MEMSSFQTINSFCCDPSMQQEGPHVLMLSSRKCFGCRHTHSNYAKAYSIFCACNYAAAVEFHLIHRTDLKCMGNSQTTPDDNGSVFFNKYMMI